LGRHLTETVLRVDRLVRQRAASRESLNHMGTTLSCLLMADGHSIIAHVGDSRIYRWRRGHLTCLTTDHTFVQEMIFEGEVSPEKADVHPLRHLLTQAVGTVEPLDHVAVRMDRIFDGDRFLLCTDGLHNVLNAGRLAAVMSLDKDAGSIAEDLVAAALCQKTTDNVTALVVRLLEKGSA
jgi:protein phosphatase